MSFRPVCKFMLLGAVAWLALGCRTRIQSAGASGGSDESPDQLGLTESRISPRHRGDSARSRNFRSADPDQDGAESDDALTEAHAHYATAVLDELNGDNDSALSEYKAAAMNDLDNETLILEISRRLVQGRQLDAALDLLTNATARSGASGLLYSRLGFVEANLGKTDDAIRANRIAIRKDPRSLVGSQNLFLIYMQDRQFKNALAVLEDAAKTPRTDAEFLIGLGELYANFGSQVPSQTDAIRKPGLEVLERAKKLNPPDLQLRLRLADGFKMLGKDDEAAPIYAGLLKELPDVPMLRDNVRTSLAAAYLRQNDGKHAAEQYESILKDDPTDANSYYALGRIAYAQTNYTQAAEDFEKVILLRSDFEPAYYQLADARMNAGKPADALSSLEQARKRFPQSFLMEYYTAMCYTAQNDFTNATAHFTAAEILAKGGGGKELQDTMYLFYFQFGSACERQGEFDEAVKHLETCLQLSPNFADAQNYLGYMWADRGENLDRARDLIGKALKVEPQNAAYLDSMGWVLYKMKQPQAALKYLLDAIKNSEEEDATLYDHLGDIYSALNLSDKAKEAWRKSFSLEKSEAVRKKLEPASANRAGSDG